MPVVIEWTNWMQVVALTAATSKAVPKVVWTETVMNFNIFV